MANFCLVYHASLFFAVSDLQFKPFYAVSNLHIKYMCTSINCEWISVDWCCWQELFAEMLAQRFFSLFCQKVGFIRPCSSSARLVWSLCITFASHLFSCLSWAKLPEYYSICYFCVPQPACVYPLMHQHLRHIWLCIRFCLPRCFCDMTCLSWFCEVRFWNLCALQQCGHEPYKRNTCNRFASGLWRTTPH